MNRSDRILYAAMGLLLLWQGWVWHHGAWTHSRLFQVLLADAVGAAGAGLVAYAAFRRRD